MQVASTLNQWKNLNRVSIIESCVAFSLKNQTNETNHFENFADDEQRQKK